MILQYELFCQHHKNFLEILQSENGELSFGDKMQILERELKQSISCIGVSRLMAGNK